MFERLRFRTRIGLLVAIAAFGLITVTSVTLVLGRRAEQQLFGIETRYVPLIELDRDLKALFAAITRALEDAASAAEESRLADADKLVAELEHRIELGASTIADNGGDPRSLAVELRIYYAAAREVSAALMAGTSAAQIAPKIEAMRNAQQAFAALLDTSTAPDRRRLAEAFATTRGSQRQALWVDIGVATSVLVLMALLSWRIIRRTARSLQAVSHGVQRLARGEFGIEIDVTSPDELGELAREGNRTAERLREYRDRTERQAEELKGLAAEQARASRLKSEFLANMSHELRTPLNSIMILSKVLSENDGAKLTDKQVEFATLIHRSGEELLGLINEVLDLAKIEAGRQDLTLVPVKPSDIEEYARRMFTPIAAQKEIGYAVEVVGDVPPSVRTDWARLCQILKNLVANAFKFTERGEVRVRITCSPAGGLAIAVSDTGIGIAADKQAWIFEAFAQAEGGTSRTYGGTGLGLTIAKQLAVRLGGDLTLESELGTGSTFRVELPVGGPPVEGEPPASTLLAPEAPPTAPSPLTAPDPDLAGVTVLIVDDDMRNVYSLSSLLRAKGLKVLTATDGREAIDELDHHPEVDVVLMDLMMPNMDGHDATRRIREDLAQAALPIIIVTASAADGERERALAAGATGFLTKPVDLSRLLEMIGQLTTSTGRGRGMVK